MGLVYRVEVYSAGFAAGWSLGSRCRGRGAGPELRSGSGWYRRVSTPEFRTELGEPWRGRPISRIGHGRAGPSDAADRGLGPKRLRRYQCRGSAGKSQCRCNK